MKVNTMLEHIFLTFIFVKFKLHKGVNFYKNK